MEDFGKVVAKRETSYGTAYIFDVTETTRAVIVFDKMDNIILARNFTYTKDTKKSIMSMCRLFYKKVKEALLKKDINKLESLI